MTPFSVLGLPAVSARRSLRWRLPVSICLLVVVVIAAYLGAAYREVEATLVRAGGDRAQNAAGQIARLLEQSAQQSADEVRRVAADVSVQRYLAEPTDATRAAARERLGRWRGAAARRAEVWTRDGARLLDVMVQGSGASAKHITLPLVSVAPRSAVVRGLAAADGVVFAEAVADIPGASPSSPAGFLVVRSTLSINPPGILNRLVGVDATIALGNKTGDVWTDLSRLIPAPPVDVSRGGIREYRTAGGDRRLGAVGDIRGTPWAVWVEFPRAAVVAPARTFLWRMLIIGAVVLILAAALVRAVSGRLTTPLEALTDAAEAIAAGDYARRVHIERTDEVGRLALAFNAMGEQIEEGRTRLEAQIAERTRTLDALRESEDKLRQAQRMEAIGRLAGGVAHDFNNLLTAILGYSDFALAELAADHPARADVVEIRKAGNSASALTYQLLAFSRQQVLQPQIIDLNAVVAQMDALLRRLIGEDIELTSQLTSPLDPVSLDRGQLEQIIMNLAVNARDAMSTGGQLTIETANVTLDDTYAMSHPDASPGPHVLLAVADTGIGMSTETIAHVFEPFFTTKPRGEGTGLGLATTYGIVKQSGGSIWVYSEPGQGATFKVYFPRASYAGQPIAAPAAAVEPSGGNETILVAEDQIDVRTLTHKILSSHGYTVLEATSGADALRIVREHRERIHLLLTDVIMPTMGGRELVSVLQETHPGIRVLYASGYTDDAIVRHGKLDPGVAFLQKPFTPTSLLAKIRDVLGAPA